MNPGNGFRRAAMIIASLDRNSADELLDRMSDEQAALSRHEMLAMSELDSAERQAAIREFLHPVAKSFTAQAEMLPTRQSDSPSRSPSIEDLLRLDNEVIASALMHERPSTMAALLASIPGDRAAMVLRLLPPPQPARVALLLGQGVATEDVVIDAIADSICETYARARSDPRPGLRHHDALQAILNAMSPRERLEMLRSLAAESPVLARRLADANPSISDCYC